MNRSITCRAALRILVIGGIAAAVVSWQRSRLSAAEIELAKVPSNVQEAAKRVAPTAKWSSADKSKEDGHDYYELVGEDASGRKVIVVATADAKVAEIKTQIALTEVPKPALQAAARKVQTFEATTAFEFREGDDIRRPEDADLSYELSGLHGTKRKVTLWVTGDGEIAEMEKEIALSDVPKVVAATLTGKMPRFRATTVYELSEEGSVVGYQFEGKRPKDKEPIDVYVSADGKEIEIDDE